MNRNTGLKVSAPFDDIVIYDVSNEEGESSLFVNIKHLPVESTKTFQ